jgi:hypothetical protein
MSWAKFAILYVAALLGGLAIAPYTLRLIESSGKQVRISPRRLVLLSVLQQAVLYAIVVVAGLYASRAVGLGSPYIDWALEGRVAEKNLGEMIRSSLVLGAAAGVVLLALDIFLLPRFPVLLEMARKTSLWENFTASFYGGVNEEFLFRLLGLSGTAWLLARLWHGPGHRPSEAAFWTANGVMAVLFALGHLPAALGVVKRVTPLLVVRALVLNVPLAVACGWLFTRFGIEAAVVAHFTADVLYHVGGTTLLRVNDRSRFLPWFPVTMFFSW